MRYIEPRGACTPQDKYTRSRRAEQPAAGAASGMSLDSLKGLRISHLNWGVSKAGTVNRGSDVIGAGLGVHDWCAFTGFDTTAMEISVIEATFSQSAPCALSQVLHSSLDPLFRTPRPRSGCHHWWHARVLGRQLGLVGACDSLRRLLWRRYPSPSPSSCTKTPTFQACILVRHLLQVIMYTAHLLCVSRLWNSV